MSEARDIVFPEEKAVIDYMKKQMGINAKMRTILVDWLSQIQRDFEHKYGTKNDALFLAVNLVDRFLMEKTVSRSHLQLVGIGAFFVAAKFVGNAPFAEDLCEMTDSAYTRDELLQMECILLNTLKFDLNVATPLTYVSLEGEESNMVSFILELSLLNYGLLKWSPSVMANAALCIASSILDKDLPHLVEVQEEETIACAKEVVEHLLVKKADGDDYDAYKKYSSQIRQRVSKRVVEFVKSEKKA